jgi:hypothetical protein
MKTVFYFALSLLVSTSLLVTQKSFAQQSNDAQNQTESTVLVPSDYSAISHPGGHKLIWGRGFSKTLKSTAGTQTDQWLQWYSGAVDKSLGTMQETTLDIAIRFDTSDLTGLDGFFISKFSFFPWQDATFTLKVWQGQNDLVEVYSQAITQYVNWQENIINLTTPLAIDASEELWIGMNVIIPSASFPLSIDAGPVVENKGNWIRYEGGEWELQPSFMGTHGNWMMGALVVETVDPVEFDVEMLHFGTITVQQSEQMVVHVANRTSQPMNLTSITTGTSVYSAEPGSGQVEAGQSMPVVVTFVPDEEGTFSDSLFVEYSGTGGSGLLKLPLTGSGLAEIIELGDWIFWDNGEYRDGLGTMYPSTIDIAIRFEASDLAAYDGRQITRFQFRPGGYGEDVFTMKIWQGDSIELVEVYSQVLTGYSLGENNIIELNTPVIVDASQELWLGMTVSMVYAAYPLAVDVGPAVENKGNWIRFEGGEWELLAPSFIGNFQGNWMLRAYIDEADSLLVTDNQMVDFGLTPVQQPEHIEIMMTNSSDATLMLMNVSTGTSFFTAQPAAWSIQPGQSTSVTVSFNPQTVDYYTDNLVVEYVSYGDVSHQLSLPLMGEGIDEVLSIEEDESDIRSINVFPNPSSGTVTLNGLNSGELISVFDTYGRLILSEIATESIAQININQRGMFFVEIKGLNKTSRSKLIIR